MRCRPSPVDQGTATVTALSFVGVLLLVTMAVATLLSAAVAHRRAQAAADLAALAGAGAPGAGCAEADRVATANGARLSSCSRDGPDLLVVVSVEVKGVPFLREVWARARAGAA